MDCFTKYIQTNETAIALDQNKLLRCLRCRFTGYTITRGINSLRIQGYVTSTVTDSQNVTLIIHPNLVMDKGWQTYSFSVTNNIDTRDMYGWIDVFGSGGSATAYTERKTLFKGVKQQIVRIINFIGTNYIGFSISLENSFKDLQPHYVDFTISDLCIYKGLLVNPPSRTSLDALDSNVFQVANTASKNLCAQVTTSKPGWYRIAMFPGGITQEYGMPDLTFISNIPFVNFKYTTGYHGRVAGTDNNYSEINIRLGTCHNRSETNTNPKKSFNRILLEVEVLGDKTGDYSKYRLARSAKPCWRALDALSRLCDRYHLYLETYYAINKASSGTNIYYDYINQGISRYINNSGNPDGNDDILVGSEVTPTMVGTSVQIPL